MTSAKKVVLISTRGYDPSHDHILRDLISRKIVLFCAVGVECELWEDAMDQLVVGPTGEFEHHVTTSSHPGESIAEVVEFATSYRGDEPTSVEVIEV